MSISILLIQWFRKRDTDPVSRKVSLKMFDQTLIRICLIFRQLTVTAWYILRRVRQAKSPDRGYDLLAAVQRRFADLAIFPGMPTGPPTCWAS